MQNQGLIHISCTATGECGRAGETAKYKYMFMLLLLDIQSCIDLIGAPMHELVISENSCLGNSNEKFLPLV